MAANREALAGKRLDSWKEIASFLGRAERTVKRWETDRGLPVHRVPGGGRSAVFAYSDELATWLKGKSSELEDDDSAAEPPDSSQAAARAQVHPALISDSPIPPIPLRGGLPASRLAAWTVPLLLTTGLAIYFWVGHSRPVVKALALHQPANIPAQEPLGPDSVAVLPFVNIHGDPSLDYLSDGLTESLIGSLAHLPHLKVRSRDSVFRYKGKDVDVRTIGSELGVSALVSGRMTLRGDVIDVSAELTNVRDNTEMWGHHYLGRRSEIIPLQQQIAGDLAQQLRTTLTSADKQQVMRQGTQNAEAYSLYLKGRYAWNKRTRPDLEKATSYFNQAIDKDPEYAQAYSGLADAYSVMHFFGGNPAEDFPKSNAAARKALELDPTLARPHAVLGNNEIEFDWDFGGGESEFKKAIELDPNDATAHQWYAEKLSAMGRHQEAIAEINRAHELDPLSPVITRVLGGILVLAGRTDEGIAVCQQLAQENPAFAIAHDCLFYAYWIRRMYPQAVEEYDAGVRLMRDRQDLENGAALERGFRSAGWHGGLSQLVAAFEDHRKTGYASPFMIARVYADLGEKDKAFEWLDTAYREHDCLLIELNAWPQFDSVRSDPRFADLVSKVGLPKLR